jgi:hypothetical protein
MSRLNDRNVQIPNGFKYLQPETGWQPPAWASFDTIVQLLIRHRQGNAYLASKHNWSTDYNTVANEVDAYNTLLCIQHGWLDFISAGAEAAPDLPKSPRPRNALQNVAVGADNIREFLKDPSLKAPKEKAERRAATCADCPKNGKGDWTTWFTVPFSNSLREILGEMKDQDYTTSFDDRLKVCTVCQCPLPFLVHFPVQIKYQRMTAEERAELWEKCWIRKEMAGRE